MHTLIQAIEAAQLNPTVPEVESGDTVRVHAKVVEGNKERIQVFEGIVIRLYGYGLGHRITVRRMAHGVGVERTFMVNSPRVDKIEIVKHAVVRRKNLYFMRGLQVKAARLR